MGVKDSLGAFWVKHRRKVERFLVGPGHIATGMHLGRPMVTSTSLYCVYRARNAHVLRRLIDSLAAGAEVHLHALDETHPSLREFTRSTGPGMRMALLQHLIDANPAREGDYLVIADDDVTFLRSGGQRCIGLAAAAGLDIAQPAHAFGSNHTFITTRVEALSTVRRTSYVEVGPFVILSPRAQARVLPFPAEAGMGWGVDIWWSQLASEGFLLGVIDATPMMHHGKVGAEYSPSEAEVFLKRQLDAAGLTSAHELPHNLGLTWRPWQRRAKWL